MKCDIKIMAIKKRRENVLRLCEQLGLDENKDVFYDDRPNGGCAIYTSERAWQLPVEEGITHRLLIQDDDIINPQLRLVVDKICNAAPDALISLFTWSDVSKYGIKPTKGKAIWLDLYTKNSSTGGQGLILPVKYIDELVEWRRKVSPNYPYSDASVFFFAVYKGLKKYCVLPNLVQHDLSHKTMLNHRAPASKYFCIGDVSNTDFSMDETNVVKVSFPTIGGNIWNYKE